MLRNNYETKTKGRKHETKREKRKQCGNLKKWYKESNSRNIIYIIHLWKIDVVHILLPISPTS